MPTIEVRIFPTMEDRDKGNKVNSLVWGMATSAKELDRLINCYIPPKYPYIGYFMEGEHLASMEQAFLVFGIEIKPGMPFIYS